MILFEEIQFQTSRGLFMCMSMKTAVQSRSFSVRVLLCYQWVNASNKDGITPEK